MKPKTSTPPDKLELIKKLCVLNGANPYMVKEGSLIDEVADEIIELFTKDNL